MGPILFQRVLLPGPVLASAAAQSRTFRTRVRQKRFLERAQTQHIDYLRNLEPPRPQRRAAVDPKLTRPWDETRHVFGYPNIAEQPKLSQDDTSLRAPRKALAPRFEGELRSFELEPFGEIKVVHGDIFEASSSAVILPMVANLCPYRGLALEALDRGGPELVTRVFQSAKQMCEAKDKSMSRDGSGHENPLISGDVVVVDDPKSERRLFFVITPYFWQGSPMDATKRLRHCVKSALTAVVREGHASVAMASLGSGIFGYEPKHGNRLIAEECVEAMLQIEAEVPNYSLRDVTLVDTRYETAEMLEDATTEVTRLWLPSERLTTAPQYFGQQNQRLIVLPAGSNFYWKRHPVKFKRNHSVVRKHVQHWKGNLVPRLWRTSIVNQPPPLLVHREGGKIADQERQLKARPFYFRGVSHWLFPTRRTGFHALRKSSRGRWVADTSRFRVGPNIKPQL